MNNLNSVLLEGNLVRNPERVELGENASKMTKYTIAVNRFFRDAKVEAVEKVMFFTIQTWGALAKSWLTYLNKGRRVRVVGRLRQERWTDKDGGNREASSWWPSMSSSRKRLIQLPKQKSVKSLMRLTKRLHSECTCAHVCF